MDRTESCRQNISKVNAAGLNRHFGESNCKWNGGNRLIGNFPCPKCGIDRNCEKRNAWRVCRLCSCRKCAQERVGTKITGNYPIGENHHNWRGGITSDNRKPHSSHEYRNWRRSVFSRDNYTCVMCKKRGGYLEADHIKPFSLFPEVRFDVVNGRTLCKDCHAKTPTYRANFIKLSSLTYA